MNYAHEPQGIRIELGGFRYSIVWISFIRVNLEISNYSNSTCGVSYLKSYSQIFCGGSAKILDFGYFVLIWWQTDKKQEILKQSGKDLFIWTELPVVSFIIAFDNMFNIEVNGALGVHVIEKNPVTENSCIFDNIL